MPLQVDHAYARLGEMLAADGVSPGQRLPGEETLSRRIGVSRPVLRQALTRLRAEGRIVARKGSGNFVAQPRRAELAAAYGPLDDMQDAHGLLEFRRVVESDAAALAAGRHEREALRALTACRLAMETAVAAGEPAIDEDLAFHVAIARASGNRFHAQTLLALAGPIRLAVQVRRQLSGGPGDECLAAVCREHARIAAAIQAGLPDEARAAMAEHLENGMQRLMLRQALGRSVADAPRGA